MMEIGRDFAKEVSGVMASMQGGDTATTRSGRAVMASQAGGMTGLASIFANWTRTKQYTGMLLAKRIQQFHSPEKMDRILGQEFRVSRLMGIPVMIPPTVQYAMYSKIKDLDFDVVVGLVDASATARQAQFNQLMQMAAIGIPVPPPIILEASDVPYKEEIKQSLAKQGMGQPNEALAKVLGAGQGQGPNGVNTSQ
jgi:hypothetical protein